MLDAFKPFSKAVAGVIAGAIVAYLTKNNIVIADNLHDSLEIVISAVLIGGAVFFAPKNKEVK